MRFLVDEYKHNIKIVIRDELVKRNFLDPEEDVSYDEEPEIIYYEDVDIVGNRLRRNSGNFYDKEDINTAYDISKYFRSKKR